MSSSNQKFPLPPITSSAAISSIDTSKYFLSEYTEPSVSPIDQYFENNKTLNLIALHGSYTKEKAAIVILGYMSAVESYLRAVFRGTISIDEYAQKLVEKMEVTYAAALHHKNNNLPEALFEGTSLASPANIKESLRDFIGIKGHLPSDVAKVLDEFAKVCEIRHCCVHRFGKLGAKNAVNLGLGDHSTFLEKPLSVDQSGLEEISYILRAVVNTINRFMYESLLDRMATNKGDQGKALYSSNWTWKYNKDKKRFLSYYNLFRSVEDTQPSPSAKEIYDVYRNNFKPK